MLRLKDILDDFSSLTSLEINWFKSFIVFSTSIEDREDLRSILGFSMKQLPIMHLGHQSSKKQADIVIVNTFSTQMKAWGQTQ